MSNGTTHSARGRANTFRAIDLDTQSLAGLSFNDFVKTLLEKLEQLRRERSAFYENLRRKNSTWANGARGVLAVLGAAALLLTALVAAIRFSAVDLEFISGDQDDRVLLVWVLVIYAVMGAISFYEKGSDKTTAYFRQIVTILAIRDLWTKLQFAVLKELLALGTNPDPTIQAATRTRILALAESFCIDLDKTATGELTEFRTEFLASLTELETASRKGLEDVTKQLDERVKAVEKAAADAKAAAEKAEAEAKAATRAAADAAKPGFVNLSLTGDFDDEVIVSISSVEVARSRGKTIAIERIAPGPTKISAQAKKGAKVLAAEAIVDVKPGLQECRLTLA